MPEGPSLVILKELLDPFIGKKVTAASGYAKVDWSLITGKKISDIHTWGKHLLIVFPGITIRVHLMMFGSYRINDTKEGRNPTMHLQFAYGKQVNFYTASIRALTDGLDTLYDWSADIMSDKWSASSARRKLAEKPEMLVCDALLDQSIFSGSGNIIKNEVMFRTRIHPLSELGKLPSKQLKLLIDETRNYAFDFLKWKKEYTLKQHWQAHTKSECPRCDIPLFKEYLGKTRRRTFYCINCQVLYR